VDVSAGALKLYRRTKKLFELSQDSLGSRGLMKKLRKEGFQLSRYQIRKLMFTLSLKVTKMVAYKIISKRVHGMV